MGVLTYTADLLTRHGVGRDGLRRWTVSLPGISYQGKALAPADWTHEQVATRLNEMAAKSSPEIVEGRLYSPTRLT